MCHCGIFGFQLEKYDLGASQTLRAALTKAEAAVPGLNYDLVAGIMRRADIPVNMNESLLRLQGTLTESECNYLNLIKFKFPLIWLVAACSLNNIK